MIESGDIINARYHVLRELGDGAFGKTFEVKDTFIGDDKVIKVLKLNNSSNQRVIKLFIQEHQVLEKLDHPGIPKVEADGYITFRCTHTEDILHGLVMEKITGEDLGKWLKNNRITNTTQAINWLKQLLDILAHVHSRNYSHRDIKPDNIMLKPDGQLVLIDFGTVKESIQKYEKQTTPSTVIGTPGYNSPEQENLSHINCTSDLFSLGRTFVHLLTGIYPGYDNFLKNPRTGKLLWRDKAPEISERFKVIIDWLIEYEPRNRPQNTQQILDLLDETSENIFPVPIVFLSLALNFVFLTLLAMGVTLTLGWKVLFLLVICGVGIFLVTPLIKYLL
ncbi:serine/threonine protein kinase [Dolichospermum sp. FACHB-1091]|jgi:serine/threonine protein kinase|uniref:serine/threonine protein kinase n=1 Tax=Dolichospermum sp. FACHB-1091 TaxID=2692798 RepID=UPI001680009A|nr:serine/threonine-protein kinase [Dolichospermum sp. FACHB-1091]MBD2444998.1 serine/threonine protein kinase [Dolichospermum sp. FACHB-1091]